MSANATTFAFYSALSALKNARPSRPAPHMVNRCQVVHVHGLSSTALSSARTRKRRIIDRGVAWLIHHQWNR